MVLDRHRGVLNPLLDPLTKLFLRVPPNLITWMSFPFAVAAGVLFYISSPATLFDYDLLFIASACVAINGVLDLVDGRVAREAKKQSRQGDFLDHTMDRFADVVILTGVALSPWADVRVGLVAVAATLLSSYIGTQAQAVGGKRLYGGMLVRADRMVLLIGLPLVDNFLARTGTTLHFLDFLPGTQYTLGLLLYYIAIGGIVTIIERFIRVWRFLGRAPPTA